jgi:hypothetical protein
MGGRGGGYTLVPKVKHRVTWAGCACPWMGVGELRDVSVCVLVSGGSLGWLRGGGGGGGHANAEVYNRSYLCIQHILLRPKD